MSDKIRTFSAWTRGTETGNHGIFGITSDPETNKVYVTNLRTPGIIVINGKTLEYEKLLRFAEDRTGFSSVAWSCKSKMLYVVAAGLNSLFIIDPTENIPIKTISLQGGPRGVAVDEKTGNILVTQYGEGWYGGGNTMVIFDGSGNLLKTIEVDKCPWEIEVDPIGRRAYIACKNEDFFSPGSVNVINLDNYTVIDCFKVGRRPRQIRICRSEGKGYVACRYDNQAYVFDLETHIIINRIDCDCDPIGIAVDEETSRVYIANRQGQMSLGERYRGQKATISVIDAKSDKVIGRLIGGKTSHYLALLPKLKRLFQTTEDSNDIIVFDCEHLCFESAIYCGRNFDAPTVNPITGAIYSTCHVTDELSIVDGESGRYLASLPTGGWPWMCTVNTKTNRIYVNEMDRGSISVIDGNKQEILDRIELGVNGHFYPGTPIVENHHFLFSHMCLDEIRERLYITCPSLGELAIYDDRTKIVERHYLGWMSKGNKLIYLEAAVDALANEVYIYNPVLNKLLFFDGAKKIVTGWLDVAVDEIREGAFGVLGYLAVDSDSRVLYVGRQRIDLNNRSVLKPLPEELGLVKLIDAEKNRIFTVVVEATEFGRWGYTGLNVLAKDKLNILHRIIFDRPGHSNIAIDPIHNLVFVVAVGKGVLSGAEIDVYKIPEL